MNQHVTTDSKSRAYGWLALAVVLAITVALYSELWNASPLSWDDDANIFNNPYFRMGMWWGVWTEPYFGLYVPVTSSVWAFLLWMGHGEAWPFRALNLSLHVANIILVYAILQSLARRWKLSSQMALGIGLALFALHPLQVQSVAWISGGRDLLAAFFALAALVIYFQRPNKSGYLGATVLFILALLSKPHVVVLPAVILAAEAVLHTRPWRPSTFRMIPWFVFACGAIGLTQWGQGAHFENLAPWVLRPILMLETYSFYIQKTIWPSPLAANYDHVPAKILSHPLTYLAALLALSILIGGLTWAWRKDRRYLMVGLWFVLLLPVSGIVPFAYENIGGVADHYNYLPMICVSILALLTLQLHRRVLFIFPIGLVLIFTAISWQRLDVWQSNTAFFSDMAETSPDSYNTAIGMSVVMCQDVKDYAMGVEWTQKALSMQANDIRALANLAFCYSQAGETDKLLTMDSYLPQLDRKMLKAVQPTAYASLLTSLGRAKLERQQLEAGFQNLCEAYQALPSNPAYGTNLQLAGEILKKAGLVPTCVNALDGEDANRGPRATQHE